MSERILKHTQVEGTYIFWCDAGIKHVVDLLNLVPGCYCTASCEGDDTPGSPYALVQSGFERKGHILDVLTLFFKATDYQIEVFQVEYTYQYRVSFRSRDIVVAATEAVNASLPDVLSARRALEAKMAAMTEDDLNEAEACRP